MNAWMEKIEARNREIDAQNQQARQNGTLVGRIIRHPYADSYAVYEVIRESAKSVRIRVVTGIGDDWVLPAWGHEATIPRKVAEELTGYDDRIAALFAAREAK